jgi:AraC-like DNA-binding protein
MKKNDVFREVTPLTSENCFIIMNRTKSEFHYPTHVHPEYELNFVQGAPGAQRVVGDSIEEIDDLDLVLITNKDLEHAWFNYKCESKCIREITIQFHSELLNENLLQRTQFHSIQRMFESARKGIAFSRQTIEKIRPKLENLYDTNGFYSVLDLFAILHELSVSTNIKILSSTAFSNTEDNNDSRRINKVTDYINKNYDKEIKLSEVASLINMSEVAFCRFFRKRTGKSLIEYLNDVRIGMATKQLADTVKPISEICYQCGFNNLSNFNRCFKKKKNCSPSEFRKYFSLTRQII